VWALPINPWLKPGENERSNENEKEETVSGVRVAIAPRLKLEENERRNGLAS